MGKMYIKWKFKDHYQSFKSFVLNSMSDIKLLLSIFVLIFCLMMFVKFVNWCFTSDPNEQTFSSEVINQPLNKYNIEINDIILIPSYPEKDEAGNEVFIAIEPMWSNGKSAGEKCKLMYGMRVQVKGYIPETDSFIVRYLAEQQPCCRYCDQYYFFILSGEKLQEWKDKSLEQGRLTPERFQEILNR